MSSQVRVYEPIQILKSVAENIWIVDGPAINFKGLDFPTRMTVIPNRIHYWWIGDWHKVYPEAFTWASPGARQSAEKAGWDFDFDLADDAEGVWRADIDQLIVRGSRFLEQVVFFHKSSRTLILPNRSG